MIAGWAAIEHGDIGEARAALSDVYAVDPAHPALPLLAASIRRTRPKRITWRSAVLLLLIVAGAAYLVQSMRTRAVQEASLSSAASADEVPAEPSLTPPSTGTASVGTSGQKVEPRSTVKAATPEAAHAPASDDEIIRQGIERFSTSYSRWTPLAFGSCDFSRIC